MPVVVPGYTCACVQTTGFITAAVFGVTDSNGLVYCLLHLCRTVPERFKVAVNLLKLFKLLLNPSLLFLLTSRMMVVFDVSPPMSLSFAAQEQSG